MIVNTTNMQLEVEEYYEEVEKRLSSFGIDINTPKRLIRQKPNQIINVETDIVDKIENFYYQYFDGRKLNFTNVMYRIGKVSFTVNPLNNIIVIDLFVDHIFAGNIFYENDAVSKEVLESANKAYLCINSLKDNVKVPKEVISRILFTLSSLTFYRMVFGDKFSSFETKGFKKALHDFYKAEGRYRPEHYTKSGKWKEGHFVFYNRNK